MEQKICTTIEQSKRLIELGLDINTADMNIGNYIGESGRVDGTNVHYYTKDESFGAPEIIPAWSLTALLELMPLQLWIGHKRYDRNMAHNLFYYQAFSAKKRAEGWLVSTRYHHNPLDAAFEMVVWLLENKKHEGKTIRFRLRR